MINTMAKLMNAWYDLLDGNLTYNNQAVDVYKEDTEEETSLHYVLLRAESETDDSNKRSFANESVVVVDIVTTFSGRVDRSVAENIDGQIGALILTDPRTSGLSAQSGMQILNVTLENTAYLTEEDETNKYYRKISRFSHRILQTA